MVPTDNVNGSRDMDINVLSENTRIVIDKKEFDAEFVTDLEPEVLVKSPLSLKKTLHFQKLRTHIYNFSNLLVENVLLMLPSSPV